MDILAHAYKLHQSGKTYAQIADELHISEAEAKRRVKAGWRASEAGEEQAETDAASVVAPPTYDTDVPVEEAEAEFRGAETTAASLTGSDPVEARPEVVEPIAGLPNPENATTVPPAAHDTDVPVRTAEAVYVGQTPLPEALSPTIRNFLTAAGYDTVEKIRDASDEDLNEIDGVGPVYITKIRAATAE